MRLKKWPGLFLLPRGIIHSWMITYIIFPLQSICLSKNGLFSYLVKSNESNVMQFIFKFATDSGTTIYFQSFIFFIHLDQNSALNWKRACIHMNIYARDMYRVFVDHHWIWRLLNIKNRDASLLLHSAFYGSDNNACATMAQTSISYLAIDITAARPGKSNA